jgi:hypothetical protein
VAERRHNQEVAFKTQLIQEAKEEYEKKKLGIKPGIEIFR